jgi:hypothetical protein
MEMQRNKVRDNDGLQSETYRMSEWGGACVTRYVCYETFSGRALEGSTSVGSLSAAGGTLRPVASVRWPLNERIVHRLAAAGHLFQLESAGMSFFFSRLFRVSIVWPKNWDPGGWGRPPLPWQPAALLG